jgi:hypothetical protein
VPLWIAMDVGDERQQITLAVDDLAAEGDSNKAPVRPIALLRARA